jgi:hypothetical protein
VRADSDPPSRWLQPQRACDDQPDSAGRPPQSQLAIGHKRPRSLERRLRVPSPFSLASSAIGCTSSSETPGGLPATTVRGVRGDEGVAPNVRCAHRRAPLAASATTPLRTSSIPAI